jgi:hypothetical protein
VSTWQPEREGSLVRRIITLTAAAVVGAALVAGPASASGSVKSVQVTSAKDAGAGSFRAAVVKANADKSVGRIVFLTASVDRSTTDGNGQDGVDFDENGVGNLAGAASRGSASNNTSAGVRADQQVSAGDLGTLSLIAMALANNPDGNVVANAGVVVTQTP